jgi:hypothetical protein
MNVFCEFWRRHLEAAAFSSFLIAMIFTGLMGCGNNPSGLVPPNFTIVSIIFTGDSTGSKERPSVSCQLERRCARGKDESYCEVTVTWNSPADQTVLSYSLNRSTEPGISSGGSDVRIVGTTTDTLLADSDSLLWATTYYYAVSALSSDSTVHWSNEGSITTPLSQLPTPSQISATDLPMGRCILTWTACPDEDFSYYTLVRRQYSGSLHGDTLGIFYGAQDTMFLDSVPPTYTPRYYQVTTTNTLGLSAKSNMLTYTSDYGLPWYMDIYWDGPYSFDKYWIIDETLTPSWDGEQIYFVEYIENQYPYFVYSCIRRMNTNNAGSTNGCGSDEIHGFAHAPGENALLVSRSIESRAYYLDLYDDYSLELMSSITVDFECDGMLVLPYSGIALIHPLNSSSSLILDLGAMELVDTLSYYFSYGQVIKDFGAYIWGVGGGLRRVDLTTLEIVAWGSSYPGHQQMVVSSKGELCYISGSTFHRCDPFSLASLYTVTLPSHEASALVEAQDTVFAYLYTSLEPIVVYNTENLTSPGYVLYKEGTDDIEISDMIPLTEQEEIWCTCRDYYSARDGAFSIAR